MIPADLSKNKLSVLEAFEKGYRVKTDGRVISPLGCEISLSVSPGGYSRFSIKNSERKRVTIPVHQLLAYQKFGDAFLVRGIQVRHLNNDSSDNTEGNIAVGTARDNEADKSEEMRRASVDAAGKARRRISDKVATEVFRMREEGRSYKQIIETLGLSKSKVNYILKKANYTRTFRQEMEHN
jgi:hypothetical protein